MTSKAWWAFVVIQLFIVVGMTLPWFFRPVPYDIETVTIRAAYIAAGWFVIFMGVIMAIKTRRTERRGRHYTKQGD